jgi:hypothetical protein
MNSLINREKTGNVDDFGPTQSQTYSLIPIAIDQNPWAQPRIPMDMMRQGWATRLFQAWQQ